MIYFDNAATSQYKPYGVYEAINYSLTHSANSGRSGHKNAIDAGLKIESCREFLLNAFNAADDYNLVFTKNCTEALNLAIFGNVNDGDVFVTSANEHNSVLRPLCELEKRGRIKLIIIEQSTDGTIDLKALDNALEGASTCVLSGVSNVTGARIDIAEAGKICAEKNVRFVLDGAQTVPLFEVDMKRQRIDMMACPGHKGLHGVQGTGFLIFKKDVALAPLLYGGTGTFSESTYQPAEAPEGFEAGTQFAGGIAALKAGAEWSFKNAEASRRKIKSLADRLTANLKDIGATLYTRDTGAGVVSFNLFDADSAYVAGLLDDADIAVRGGLHCAPLVHRFFGTTLQGAVRASLGTDSTDKEVAYFLNAIDKIAAKLKRK